MVAIDHAGSSDSIVASSCRGSEDASSPDEGTGRPEASASTGSDGAATQVGQNTLCATISSELRRLYVLLSAIDSSACALTAAWRSSASSSSGSGADSGSASTSRSET